MNQSKQNPVVVVMGAGNATGSAVARRFASEGYTACVSRRNEEKLQPLIQSIEEAGGQARAFGADARKEEQVQAMFRTIEEEIGPIEVCVFNVGGNVKFPLEDTTSRVYYKVWEMG
ncbi:MAG: SDR family NAD(P)-dependent oxidoreductase, partial [SAR324 cluster bacterium]|nr:SDR family NAD(P)-dependent oxidoreductase [SAR324 cluster bacterium]